MRYEITVDGNYLDIQDLLYPVYEGVTVSLSPADVEAVLWAIKTKMPDVWEKVSPELNPYEQQMERKWRGLDD